MNTSIILASASPRRSELLALAGIEFRVEVSKVEEVTTAATPSDLAIHNARIKAQAVAERFPNKTILGADTIVVLGDTIFGKPSDLADARRILEALAGRTHEVLTGVCILRPDASPETFVETTHVTFRLDPDIAGYLALVNTLDKAGAYALQEYGDMLIERIEGCPDNVIGLPISRLLLSLQNH